MGKDFAAIVETMIARRTSRSPIIDKMSEVLERYNGEWVIPGYEDLPALTPALVADAVDFNAQRASSVLPTISCPALRGSEASQKRAHRRRRALSYSWDKSHLGLHLRRAYRHMGAYGHTAMLAVWDFDKQCAMIELRDPLNAFPEPRAPEDLRSPADCGFIYAHSAEWLKANYPEKTKGIVPTPRGTDQLWEVVEWIDEDDIVIGLLGPRESYYQQRATGHVVVERAVELDRFPNRAGVCTAVVPTTVGLSEVHSAVSHMLGNVDLQARMMALDILATEKSIFPDTFIVGSSDRPPVLVGGEWKDGRTGEANVILDASNINQLRNTPDPAGQVAEDRLERNFRVSTGLVPQAGGEPYGAMRTGRGVEALMSAAVDPRVQEMQEVMGVRLTEVNDRLQSLYEGHALNRKFTVFSGWPTDDQLVEFTPGDDFETHENTVRYPIPGADISTMNVVLGQLLSIEAISQRQFRQQHPWIADAELTDREVMTEQLDRALMQSILQRVSNPESGFAVIDFAKLQKLVAGGTPLADAVEQVDREARERQAAEAPEPQPGQAAAPETLPGVGNPSEGVSAPPAVSPPSPSSENLRRILTNLSSTASHAGR